MPYSSIDELPEAVKSRYSEKCQRVFMTAHNGHDGDEASKMRVAHTAAGTCMTGDAVAKAVFEARPVINTTIRNRYGELVVMRPMKASPLDDDAFRLLAFPFTGPIPMPGTKGVDLDGQWFTAATDIKPDWLPFRPTDWHHGADPTNRMGRTVLGKAIDLGRFDGASREPDDDGWWVTVWLNAGERRLDLVRRLAERGAQLFGSSETVPGLATVKARDGQILPWKAGLVGEIVTWPYWRQTLSTSPQNTHSVLRPLKATLDEIEAAGEHPGATFWSDVEDALRSLGASLQPPSVSSGADGAKAGRVLRRSSEADLRAALAAFEEAAQRVLSVLSTQPERAENGDDTSP